MLLKEYLHVILNAMALGPDSSFHNTLSICVHMVLLYMYMLSLQFITLK